MKVVVMPFISILFLFTFSAEAVNEMNYVQLSQKNSARNTNGDCKASDQFDFTSKNGIEALVNISKYIGPSCESKLDDIAKYYKPYTKDYCDKVVSCRNIKLGKDANFDTKKLYENNAEIALQEKLHDKIVYMERIERVRKFAEKKGMSNIGQNCSSRFISTSSNPQNICNQRLNQSFNSYSVDNKEYSDFKSNDSLSKDNKFSDYFTKRVEFHTSNLIANHDDSNIDNLSTILTMPDKTNDEKKKLFVDFIKKQDEAYLLDPILAWQHLQDFEIVYKDFLDNTLNQKQLTKEEAKKRLLTYREEKAKFLLGKENCTPATDFDNLCKEANEIANGKRVSRSLFEAVRVFSNEKVSPNYNVLKRIRAMYFPNEAESDNYDSAKIILEAMRCSSFVFNYVSTGDVIDTDYTTKLAPKALPVEDDETPKVQVSKVNDGVKATPSDTEKAPTAEVATKNNTIAAPENTHVSNINSSINNSGNPFSAMSNGPANILPAIANEDASQSNAPVNPNLKEKSNAETDIQNKISDLSKRLEDANDKISKMNAVKEIPSTVQNDGKKASPISDDSKLVNDLKSQIKDLKEQKAAIEQKNEATTANRIIKPQSVISGVDAIDSGEEKRILNNNDRAKAMINDSENASRSISTVEPKKVYDSSKKAMDIVLTDSSMKPAENFSDAINKKIIELDSKPFYIEEGGMIKEIIPILNIDGKVVMDEKGEPKFEKITRGKVGEKFVLPKGSVFMSAPTTTIGDLVRKNEEQMKKSRNTTRYEELMKTTSDGINKNN